MQNRYVADIGDYGKYGLLRSFEDTSLKLGLNWYLAPDESHNADGKHISYLNQEKYSKYDPELYIILKEIITTGIRDVKHIQASTIFQPTTIYYSDVLDFSSEKDFRVRKRIRDIWHNKALNTLKDCDIIFLDPDNGLQSNSVSLTSGKGNKYIGIEELRDYCRLGKSIIFYNHRERKKEDDYLKKFKLLKNDAAFSKYEWLGLKYVKGTIRDYFFIINSNHYETIKKQYNKFLLSNWQDVFTELNLQS